MATVLILRKISIHILNLKTQFKNRRLRVVKMMLGEPCTLYFLLLFTILSEIISSNITCFGFSLIEDLVILHVHILKFIFSKLTYVNVMHIC